MEMRFISEITVRPIQSVGGDSMVCAAAKVSTSGEEAAALVDAEANGGLIAYLMKHRHGTPFEHASMTFFVHAPIFVWREWHRHRIGFSYNEESGRYKQLDPVFYVPPRDRPMMKVDGWKPGRPKFLRCEEALHTLQRLAQITGPAAQNTRRGGIALACANLFGYCSRTSARRRDRHFRFGSLAARQEVLSHE